MSEIFDFLTQAASMTMKVDSGVVITILLVLLCLLAGLDLWRQYALNSENQEFLIYSNAMKGKHLDSSSKFWKLGYRLEDLEDILTNQYQKWRDLRSALENTKLSAVQRVLEVNSLRQSDTVMVKSNDVKSIRQSRIVVHQILTNDSSVYHIHCDSSDGPLLRVGENDFRTDARDQCQLFGSTTQSSVVPGPHNMFEVIPIGEGKTILENGR